MIGDFTYDMNDFQKQYIKSVMDIVRSSVSEYGSKLGSLLSKDELNLSDMEVAEEILSKNRK